MNMEYFDKFWNNGALRENTAYKTLINGNVTEETIKNFTELCCSLIGEHCYFEGHKDGAKAANDTTKLIFKMLSKMDNINDMKDIINTFISD